LVHRITGKTLRSGDTMDFGRTRAGQEVWSPYLLKNMGSTTIRQPLILEITGPDAADFRVGQRPQYPLRAKGMTPLFATFKPRADGPATRTAQLILRREGSEAFVIHLTGSVPLAPAFNTQPQDHLGLVGSSHVFACEVGATGPVRYQWFRNGKLLRGATANSLMLPNLTREQAGEYAVEARTAAGRGMSSAARLGVVATESGEAHAAIGKSFTLDCQAAGPGLTFQWLRDGQPVPGGTPDFTGTTLSKLQIRSFARSHEGGYRCSVSLGSLTETAPVVWLYALERPTFYAGLSKTQFFVAEPVEDLIQAGRDPLLFAARGLPPGLILNSKTGQISGKASSPGTFNVTFTATNAAGVSDPFTQTLQVLPLPAGIMGRFAGLIEREQAVTTGIGGEGLGGMFDLQVTISGSFSARLRYGVQSRSGKILKVFAGRLSHLNEPGQQAGIGGYHRADNDWFQVVVRAAPTPSQFDWVSPEGELHGQFYAAKSGPSGLMGRSCTLSKYETNGVEWSDGTMKVSITPNGSVLWSGRLAPADGNVRLSGSTVLTADQAAYLFSTVRIRDRTFSATGSLSPQHHPSAPEVSWINGWFTWQDRFQSIRGSEGYGFTDYE
jgi:hypothetical protein